MPFIIWLDVPVSEKHFELYGSFLQKHIKFLRFLSSWKAEADIPFDNDNCDDDIKIIKMTFFNIYLVLLWVRAFFYKLYLSESIPILTTNLDAIFYLY